MTFLELVQKVLRRLGEPTIASSNETAYSRLVADIVADAHQEVVHAHEWTKLRATVDFNLTASQRTYDLSRTTADGGALVVGSTPVLTGSYLLTERGVQAWLFNDASDANGATLSLAADNYLEYLYQSNRDMVSTDPTLFSLNNNPAQDGYLATIWPTPSTTKRVRMRFWIPEGELETDGTDDSTVIKVPHRPIYLLALAMAERERGEEIGEPVDNGYSRYFSALQAAIDADTMAGRDTNTYEFWVD